MRDQLKELERQLLLDDDENESNTSGSAITDAEFGDKIQRLLATLPLQPTAVTAAANHLSPSPTNSSSSTVSSFASFSPPSVSSPSPTSRQMLLDTAAATGEGNLELAITNLVVIRRAANPCGDAEQRLTALMYATLFSLLNNPQTGSSHAVAELRTPEHFAVTQMMYDLSPCFKLAFITANSSILEATRQRGTKSVRAVVGIGELAGIGEARRWGRRVRARKRRRRGADRSAQLREEFNFFSPTV